MQVVQQKRNKTKEAVSENLKVQHIKRTQLDEKKWDACIQTSSFPTLYALAWYLDNVSPNWEALIIGDYDYVFPLTVKRKLKTIKYIGAPPFCQQLGVFGNDPITQEIIDLFLGAIPSFYVRQDIALNHSNPFHEGCALRDNFVVYATQDFKAGYSSQTKRNLKTASKYPLSIDWNIDFLAVIDLFVANKGREIDTIDYSLLKDVCGVALIKSVLHSVGVKLDGVLVSGALFVEFQQRWYMIMLASSKKGKESLASTLIIDEVIQKLIPKQFALDFEGSSIPSLARFYSGFGAKNEPYQMFTNRIF